MEDLVRNLPGTAWVLDLGSGGGSFDYTSTRARVVAVDLQFPPDSQICFARLQARADRLPLRAGVVDVVVCNHSLEHIEELEQALSELNRVIKNGARVWVAIPDGFSWDDRLYRFLFAGGGHVQRFSFRGFLEQMEARSSLRLLRFKALRTGFVYLNPPDPGKVLHYPARARRLLAYWPASWLETVVRWMNYLVRVIDGLLGTKLSRYGWGFVFEARRDTQATLDSASPSFEEMPEDVNVCFSCGAGHPDATLHPVLFGWALWQFFVCPNCEKLNLFYARSRRAGEVRK